VDIKVFVTQPNAPVHVDMVLPGRAKTKLLRSTYPTGLTLINNLVAFEEMKLDDVKLSELASLQARCRPRAHESQQHQELAAALKTPFLNRDARRTRTPNIAAAHLRPRTDVEDVRGHRGAGARLAGRAQLHERFARAHRH
jgi:hypothetical protein